MKVSSVAQSLPIHTGMFFYRFFILSYIHFALPLQMENVGKRVSVYAESA